MKKNRKKLGCHFCCYTYKGTFQTQYIFIKYEDDMKAIDLLLKNDLEKQALRIADQNYNVFK